MRYVLAVLAALWLATAALAQQASSVHVLRDEGGGVGTAGTGTVIACEDGRSLVLTAAHVVPDGAKPLAVVLPGGRRTAATYLGGSAVVATGPQSIQVQGPDLAVLSVAAELPAVEVADRPPAVGSRVRQFGYGGRVPGSAPSSKAGVVADRGRYAGEVMCTSLPCQSGDSGAGLFDDADELVGVTVAKDPSDPARCDLAVPAAVVVRFVPGPARPLFPRLSAKLSGRKVVAPPPAVAPKAQQPCPNGKCPLKP